MPDAAKPSNVVAKPSKVAAKPSNTAKPPEVVSSEVNSKPSKDKVALPSNWGETEEEGDAQSHTTTIAPVDDRESWGSKLGYLLTLVGYAVGFGNIWRFPALLHENGGVAFLIPYCVMLAVEGIPIFFLELAIGQRLRKGALGCWNEISPYLGGLGISMGLTCYFVELYYNTLAAWVISYMFDSFRSDLAWTNCSTIYKQTKPIEGDKTKKNSLNETVSEECERATQSTKYYWYRKVLDVSDGINSSGEWNWWLFMCIIIGWFLVWLILINGIKSSEKVVYFTALFPYFTLLCFFIGNFFQEGWQDGYYYLFKPDFSVLSDATVWLRAATQIFFSLGVGFGCLIVFASYLPSNNNCYKDAVLVSIINCATSLFAACVVFPVLGSQGTRIHKTCMLQRKMEALGILGLLDKDDFHQYTEQEQIKIGWDYETKPVDKGWIQEIRTNLTGGKGWENLDIGHPILLALTKDCDLEAVIRDSGSGTGLVFMSFAQAAVHLPAPPFWCFLFFIMLLTLGIDSSFGTCEGAIAALVDLKLVKWPRWVITTVVVSTLMVLSLVFAAGFGIYVQVFLDTFVANWSLLIIAFFELVGISWVYGLAKFSYDIKLMTGTKPNMYMMICWKFVSPVLLIFVLIMSFIQQEYNYDAYDRDISDVKSTPYPKGMVAFGFIIWLAIILWVPIQAILKVFGKSILKEETPAYFPEEELRVERHMSTDYEETFDQIDKLLMGKSINDFKVYREKRRSSAEHHHHDHHPQDAEGVPVAETPTAAPGTPATTS